MSFLRMSDLDLRGKRVLIREDLNVPIRDGVITSTQRLAAALPAICTARDAGAAVMVFSHLGRPTEGVWDAASSLAPVAAWLATALDSPVPLLRDYLHGVEVSPGTVVMLENCRMNVGENEDAEELARQYAALCRMSFLAARATPPSI